MYYTIISSVTTVKVYTQKELVLLETLISEFHSKYYIPEIKNLAFHLPPVGILRMNHCGK